MLRGSEWWRKGSARCDKKHSDHFKSQLFVWPLMTQVCVRLCFVFFLFLGSAVHLSVYTPVHHMDDTLHARINPWNDEMHFTVMRVAFVSQSVVRCSRSTHACDARIIVQMGLRGSGCCLNTHFWCGGSNSVKKRSKVLMGLTLLKSQILHTYSLNIFYFFRKYSVLVSSLTLYDIYIKISSQIKNFMFFIGTRFHPI